MFLKIDKQLKKVCLAALLLTQGGCYFLQGMTEPLEQIAVPASENRQGTDLMILLPGMGDYPESYVSHGFIAALQKQRLGFDVIAVNTHFKYYQSRTLLERVKKDVIEPAQAKGYKRIHIGGISMGGYGALLLDREFPNTFTTVTLFAPYLGEEDFYTDFKKIDPKNYATLDEGNLWPWLTSLHESQRNRIYLSFGEQDRLASIDGKLAELIPVENTLTDPGNHKWTTWMPLWEKLLLNPEYLRF